MAEYLVNYFSPKAKPEVVTGTDPAAGAEISETVPDGEVWELLAVRFVLVTDATVATRDAKLTFTDGTTTFHQIPNQKDHTASVTNTYNYAAGGHAFVHGSNVHLPLPTPPFKLLPGWVIKTVTGNLQSGDNYGAPVLLVVKGSAS